MRRRTVVLGFVLLVALAGLTYRLWPESVPHVPPWEPAEGFIRDIPDAVRLRHEYHLDRIRKHPPDLIFFGDSIARGWEDHDDLWNRIWEPRKTGLFATSHDTTSNLLWRIDHGELDNVSPKAVIILIGTNNRKDSQQSPDDVAKGIETVVQRVRSKQPRVKILLLAILPQGRRPSNSARPFFALVNAQIAKLADAKTIFFRDHGPFLLEPDGTLSEAVSPDATHFSKLGYERWATAMEADLRLLLAD